MATLGPLFGTVLSNRRSCQRMPAVAKKANHRLSNHLSVMMGVWLLISPHQPLQARTTHTSTPRSINSSKNIENPLSLLKTKSAQFALVSGSILRRRMNVVFIANSSHQLLACLSYTDWISARPSTLIDFLDADVALLRHHFDLAAPLKRWLWDGRPQTFQLAAPLPGKASFIRDELRIWSTGKRQSSGGYIFVGATSQERMGPWYWLEPTVGSEIQSRVGLIHSLSTWTYGTKVRSVPLFPGHRQSTPEGKPNAGDITIINLRHCSER